MTFTRPIPPEARTSPAQPTRRLAASPPSQRLRSPPTRTTTSSSAPGTRQATATPTWWSERARTFAFENVREPLGPGREQLDVLFAAANHSARRQAFLGRLLKVGVARFRSGERIHSSAGRALCRGLRRGLIQGD